jgi:hypothetical protein
MRSAARPFDGTYRGIGGRGINMLTGAEAVAPYGGAAFHDNKVWVKKAASSVAQAI